jgi:HAD superfamily hydrolase (TIGR01509 family)
MDGVIFNTNQVHSKAFKETLDKLSEFFEYKKYGGMNTEQTLKEFFSDPELLKKLKEEKQKKTLNLLKKAEIYRDVDRTIGLLHNLGIKTAVSTSASKERTYKMLNDFGLLDRFNQIVTADDVNEAKPNPRIYEETLKRLNISREEVIVIEDSESGIKAAKAAGIEVIALKHTSDESSIKEANFILRDMSSLYAAIHAVYLKKKVSDKKPNELERIAAVIPAAGKGIRLNFSGPKILYPINDTTPLEIQYLKLRDFSDKIIVIASPEGASEIEKYISKKGMDIEVKVIENSKGTADSVLSALPLIGENEQVLVLWGDQIGIRKETIKNLLCKYDSKIYDFGLPVVIKKDPYIHLDLNEEGTVRKVCRKRFGDFMPEYGINDAGIFVAKNSELLKVLKTMKQEYISDSNAMCEEFDFLSVIPLFSSLDRLALIPDIVDEKESIGMNTSEEAEFHKKIFQ